MEHDGNFYCGIHDPVRLQQKRAAQDAKWRADLEAERAARKAAADKQAALERDAARYRWLRDCTKETELLIYSRGADLDAAIDAAMKAP
jgi:hypothetical protein